MKKAYNVISQRFIFVAYAAKCLKTCFIVRETVPFGAVFSVIERKVVIVGKGKNGNLIPINERPIEEQKAIRQKAVEAKRERKRARECMEMILSGRIKSKNAKKALKEVGVKTEDMQNTMLLMLSLFQNGVKTGDSSTIRTILEIAGDMETEQETKSPSINITVSAATQADVTED